METGDLNGRRIVFFLASVFLYVLMGCSKRIDNGDSASDTVSSGGDIQKMELSSSKDFLETIDSVEISHIAMESVAVSGVTLGDSTPILIEKLGDPDYIELVVNEFNGDTTSRYYFNESFFDIDRGMIDGFTVVDAKFVFVGGGVKVGDDVVRLKGLFLDSYLKRYAIEDSVEIVKIMIGYDTDEYLMFKIKDKRIVSYFTWINW